jgi:6,7-dimethyl-8-ribityllumazine synthase
MAKTPAKQMKKQSGRFLVVVARFNEMITRCLLTGAQDTFNEAGLADQVETVWVPGCFEIPVVATTAARSGKYAAIVTLGAVIKGETPHFDYVAGECARGVMEASRETGTPVIFGVLTTNTVEQALNRSGIKFGNKGRDAASAAIEMAETMAKFNGVRLS